MATSQVMNFVYGLDDCKPNELKQHLLMFANNKQTKNTEADPIGEFNGELLKGELSNV